MMMNAKTAIGLNLAMVVKITLFTQSIRSGEWLKGIQC
jgi:hypothetical protein